MSNVVTIKAARMWTLALLASACNAPSYSAPNQPADPSEFAADAASETGRVDGRPADAGAVDGGAPDAEPVRPAPPDTVASPPSGNTGAALLAGKYAIQVRFYGEDPTLGTLAPMVNELIMLATIEPDVTGGNLTMTAQLCRDRGEVRGPFSQLFAAVVRPELQPTRTWSVIVQDDTFRTEGLPTRIGYDERAPTGCSPGVKLQRKAEQVWLGAADAVCSCPSSDLPPTQLDDCRVNDVDGDMHPGVTIALSGAMTSQQYVRSRDSSQFVDGIIATGGRHRSAFDKLEELYQLDCSQRSCTRANLRACPARFNTAQFAPLPDLAAGDQPWSCASLMTEIEAGKYASPEPLDFLVGC